MARVLIVDDSLTEMHELAQLLEKHGHQVLKAGNGADGVALARQETPDAVLMDVEMPDMNGFHATRQLDQDPRTTSIPVLLMAAEGQETNRMWAQHKGAVDFLNKPVGEDALIAKLKEVLAS